MNLSLANRFLAGIVVIALVLLFSFYAVAQHSIELIEAEVIQNLLMEMLHDFVQTYENQPGATPPQHGVLTGYVVQAGKDSPLPSAILSLTPGFHDDIIVGDSEFMVGREDVNGTRIYFLLDIRPVERIEAGLVTFASFTLLLAIAVSTLLAVGLSRLITRPITQLAQALSNQDPRQRQVRLADNFRGQEVSSIAAAFDRYTERLDEFLRREQAFTEDASHELRTPLTVMVSGIRLLQEDPQLSDQTRQRVERLARAASRMQETVEALMFLAREEGNTPSGECRVDTLLEEATATLHEQATPAAGHIHLAVEPTVVHAPAALVASVIQNLLGNALHHTHGAAIHVTLQNHLLVIADEGAGIAPELLPQVFERGQRGSQSQGLGLGLAIVRRICERLGWQISVSSGPQTGTRFEISLPPAA